MKFDKLVRDKIPEIIASEGKEAIIRILDDQEYKVYLEKKLDEEVAEFHESKSLEELADILEVVYALIHVYGSESVYLTRLRKLVERGGFTKKILLKDIIENEKPIKKV